MIPATVNVFEKKKEHCLMIKNGIEVELTKQVLSHPRGNTTRDICEEKEFNNPCEEEGILKPDSSDSDGRITYLN